MKSSPGKNLVEYALIAALIAIVALPAIAFLGGVINNGLAQSGDLTQANDLFALLDTRVSGSGSGTTASPAIAVDKVYLADPGQVLLEVGEDGGIIFPNMDPEGLGAISTSVDGTERIVEIMEQALQTGELPNGTKLPPDFDRQALEALVTQGRSIADKQRHLLNVENKSETKHLFERTSEFYTRFNDFRAYLSTYSGDPTVRTSIEQYVGTYSGIIGNLSVQVGEHYNQKIGLTSIDTEYFDASTLPSGMPPLISGTTFDLNGTPVITDFSATQINQVNTSSTSGG